MEVAYATAVMMNHLSTMAQTLILLSTGEFSMVRLNDRHCSGSSIMPQKRNPCSLEVLKAKASFAHGVVASLLSLGKGLFMGYNRDTQWTKYWIMDLVDESRPALSVMTEVICLLKVHQARMLEQAQKDFSGATSLMEGMVRLFDVPLRKAKMALEKAVRYSEEEGSPEVSYGSLQKALREMKMNLSITEEEMRKLQRPETTLAQTHSVGTPSERRIKDNIVSLQARVRTARVWVLQKRRSLQKAKDLVLRMEKELMVERTKTV